MVNDLDLDDFLYDWQQKIFTHSMKIGVDAGTVNAYFCVFRDSGGNNQDRVRHPPKNMSTTTAETVQDLIARHAWTEPREVQTKRGPRMVSDTTTFSSK